MRSSLAIRSSSGHGIEGIGHRNDTCLYRNSLSAEAVGKSSSVQPLMVGAYDPQHIGRLMRQGRQHPFAQGRMLRDLAELVRREGAGFV
jgi:hypothetical protein